MLQNVHQIVSRGFVKQERKITRFSDLDTALFTDRRLLFDRLRVDLLLHQRAQSGTADRERVRNGLLKAFLQHSAQSLLRRLPHGRTGADAVTRMTTELLAGNVPELLDCSDLSGAQYAGYAKNGILLPLDGMPDAELLSGILKPCYVDGKLYSIVGAFALDPLFGPAEKLGASLETSVEDVLCGAVPNVSFFWGGEDLLSVYCRHAAEQYLDYDSQTASFESEKFLNILTACAAVSSAAPAPDSIMQQPMRSTAMYRSMQIFWYQQTGGAFRVLALDSDGGTAYQPVLQLGVCVGSAMREAAEETLRNMLQEDFQLTIADAFPVNRAALRELMQKEIEAQRAEQQTAIREEGRVEVGEAGDLAFLFDEAAADDLMNVLEHADCRSCGNQEILKIILDEADAFFKGRKTAQEAAQVMDRRAALFIAEAG